MSDIIHDAFPFEILIDSSFISKLSGIHKTVASS